MKNIKVLTIIIIIIVIPNLNSCNFSTEFNETNSTDSLLTKTVKFPNTLLHLDGDKLEELKTIETELASKRKFISIIDGNCSKCIINELNNLSYFFNAIKNKEDLVVFILNIHKEDSIYFRRNFQPLIDAEGIILWDNNYNFEKENNLFTKYNNRRTFMVNKKNKIILYGNPVQKPDIIDDYKKKIKKKTHYN